MYREIGAQQELAHPNIMPVWDHDPAYQWYTMPIADGTLYEQRASLKEDDFIALLVDISQALEAAHAQRHVHRDVSPKNILHITSPETPKQRWVVSDWGLVLRPPTSTTPPLTVSGQGLGTPGFSAPELMTNAKYESSPKVDVYSLGRLAEWYLSGKWPTQGITHLPGGDNQHWRQFIRVCTAPHPDDRPNSMQDVQGLLRLVLEGRGRSAISRAYALLDGVIAGNDDDLRALSSLALAYSDDAALYLDCIAVMTTSQVTRWVALLPKQAAEASTKMAWHIMYNWEGRDSTHIDAALGFVHNVLQNLFAMGQFGYGEDMAPRYFMADRHTGSSRHKERTIEWLADLDGTAAEVIYRVLAQDADLLKYYATPSDWEAASPLLTALLAK
jgi:serine/threonine-protein kinase